MGFSGVFWCSIGLYLLIGREMNPEGIPSFSPRVSETLGLLIEVNRVFRGGGRCLEFEICLYLVSCILKSAT